MGKPVKTHIKRIEVALNKSKKKFVSLADLSKMVGVYQDALGEELSYFCPLIRIDYSINCRDLLPDLKKFLLEKQEPAKKKREYHRKDAVRAEELQQYSSTMDYIYNIIRLAPSGTQLERRLKRLAGNGLFPLPKQRYTATYTLFRTVTGNRLARTLLTKLLKLAHCPACRMPSHP